MCGGQDNRRKWKIGNRERGPSEGRLRGDGIFFFLGEKRLWRPVHVEWGEFIFFSGATAVFLSEQDHTKHTHFTLDRQYYGTVEYIFSIQVVTQRGEQELGWGHTRKDTRTERCCRSGLGPLV